MYRRIRSPKQRFIRSFVSRQHFPAQRKGGGISKGGNPGSPLWLRAEGTPCTDCRLIRTNQTRTDYPDNIQHYLPPRRESIGAHDRANGMSDYANCSVRARTSVTLGIDNILLVC